MPPQIDDPTAPIPKGSELAWQFEPSIYVDQEKIGINTGQIRRIARVAGFSGVLVTGYQGEASQFKPRETSVNGWDTDAAATGSASGTFTKVEGVKWDIGHVESDAKLFTCNQWPRLTLSINRAEMANQVSSRIHGGDTQYNAWSQEISSTLRQGLASAIIQRLGNDFYEHTLSSVGSLAMMAGMLSTIPSYIFDNGPLIAGPMSVGIHTAMTIHKLWSNRKTFGTTLKERYRVSAMAHGGELDRVILAGFMCQYSKLAKPLGKAA